MTIDSAKVVAAEWSRHLGPGAEADLQNTKIVALALTAVTGSLDREGGSRHARR